MSEKVIVKLNKNQLCDAISNALETFVTEQKSQKVLVALLSKHINT